MSLKEIAEAYAVLSNPQKGAAYDAGGVPWGGTPEDLFKGVDFDDLSSGFGFGDGGLFDRFFHRRAYRAFAGTAQAHEWIGMCYSLRDSTRSGLAGDQHGVWKGACRHRDQECNSTAGVDHGIHRHKDEEERPSNRAASTHSASMMPPRQEPEGQAEVQRGSRWRKANMVFGVLLLATLIVVLTHVTEERQFVALLTHLTPTWLLVAAGCQVGTYFCAAAVWSCVLHRAGVALRLYALVPLGLAKLFVDQIIPTAGVGGTMLVVRGLVRRGVPPPLATAALLMDLLSFYAAHAGAVLLAVGIVWVHHDMHPVILTLTILFAVIAVGVPLTILRLNRRGSRILPPWLRRLPILARVVQAMAAAPAEILRDRWLLLQTSILQFTIIVLDAATLDVMLRAIGYLLAPAAVFASFTMSALLAILGVIPGGLGLFEGGAVVMLRWFGVPVEAGLAATLLLRAWTFWLPRAPGMWMAHHEAHEPGL